MKNKIRLLLILLICCCLVFTGCGEKTDEAAVDAENDSAELPPEAKAEAAEAEAPIPSLSGKWIYNFYDIFFTFSDEGKLSYETPTQEGELSYSFDGVTLELKDGDKLIGSGRLNEDGNIVFDNLNGCFYPEGSSAYEPMSGSESALLGTNAEIGEQRNPLPDAVAFFNAEKDYYELVDGDWAVLSAEPEIKDGYKTVTVVAACYVPNSNVPLIDFPFHYNCGLYLYDKYTGLVFSTNSFFEVEEDGFIHAFDSEKGRVELSFHRGRNNSGPYGDCYDIMGFDYTFRFPEWYDGLMLAATPRPDDIDTLLESMNELEQPLGLKILPYSGNRAESGLRFNIK